MKKQDRFYAIILPTVEGLGFELYGVEYQAHAHTGLLRIYIDSQQGVTLDDCSLVSTQVSAVLDVEDPIAGQYTLEVSSPGVERPLFTLEHFKRYAGKKVQVRLYAPLDGRKNFTGIIDHIDDDHIVLDVDGEKIKLPLASITKAHLIFAMD